MGCSDSKIIPIKHSKTAETPALVPTKRISVTSVGDPEAEPEIGMSDENWNDGMTPMDEDGANGEMDLDVDYITEHSETQMVKQVEREFVPRENIELVITGTACSRLISGGQKTRMEEAAILKSLIDEGLISKPLGKTATGLSFEIVEDEDKSGLATASRNEFSKNRLATLEEHRGRFNKQMSTEKINEKLLNAESRRKRNIKQFSISETEQGAEGNTDEVFKEKSDNDFDEPEFRPPGRKQSNTDLKLEKIKLDNTLHDNFAMMDLF